MSQRERDHVPRGTFAAATRRASLGWGSRSYWNLSYFCRPKGTTKGIMSLEKLHHAAIRNYEWKVKQLLCQAVDNQRISGEKGRRSR